MMCNATLDGVSSTDKDPSKQKDAAESHAKDQEHFDELIREVEDAFQEGEPFLVVVLLQMLEKARQLPAMLRTRMGIPHRNI